MYAIAGPCCLRYLLAEAHTKIIKIGLWDGAVVKRASARPGDLGPTWWKKRIDLYKLS